MSTASVAKDLVELCRAGKNIEAVQKLYSPDIVSVESASGPSMPAETKGIDAIEAKNKWWIDNHTINKAEVNGPLLGENDQFAVEFNYDVTFKESGQRMNMNEMALYTVKGDKIVREHFFYPTGSQS